MPLFRAMAKNMAPMTNADESPTNRLTLFPIYLSLFIVSTLCLSSLAQCQRVDTIKREMFSQKSVRRFVGDSSAFVMGAMFLASALKRGISPRY